MSDSDVRVVKKKQKLKNDQSAGRGNAYSARAHRLLYETQSTDSNQSTQTSQEIGEIIIEISNDHGATNCSHSVPARLQDNKAAERSRLYRERHREEINRRRRHSRQRLKKLQRTHAESHTNIGESQQVTATGARLGRNPHTERQRRYYERHREEINKRKRDNRMKLNTSPSVPVTAAERNRNYRKRNKQEINERRRIGRLRQQHLQILHAAVRSGGGGDETDTVIPNCEHGSVDTSRGITFSAEPSLSAAWPSALDVAGWGTESRGELRPGLERGDTPASGGGRVRPGATPVADVTVCRICLATDCKLYAMTDSKILSQAYETLTGLIIQNEDNLPSYLCCACSTRLLNCANFRATSLRSHLTLLEIVKEHGRVTVELIQSVKEIQNPQSLNLNDWNNQASYDIEIELNQKQNMDDDALREDENMTHSAVSGIKVEDCSAHNTMEGDGNISTGLSENTGVFNIKVEKDYANNQDILNAESILSGDVTRASLPDNVVDSIKGEHNDIIYHNSFVEKNTADNTTHINNLPKDIAVNVKTENLDTCNDEGNNEVVCADNAVRLDESIVSRVKIESGNLMKKGGICSDNADAELRDVSIVDYLPNASQPSAGVSGMMKRDSTTVKVYTRRTPKPNIGLSVDDSLSSNRCPSQTNRDIQRTSHSGTHVAGNSCD